MQKYYRPFFIGFGLIPAFELVLIPLRRPLSIGGPDAAMALMLVICGIGLVLTDILRQLAGRSMPVAQRIPENRSASVGT